VSISLLYRVPSETPYYSQLVDRPMDLDTILHRLQAGADANLEFSTPVLCYLGGSQITNRC
jgi:hypothetical protein